MDEYMYSLVGYLSLLAAGRISYYIYTRKKNHTRKKTSLPEKITEVGNFIQRNTAA